MARSPGKEVLAMTGSALVPFVVPIVALVSLGIWLTLVYRADAHPGYKSHTTSVSPDTARTGEAAAGEHGTAEQDLVPPARRAA